MNFKFVNMCNMAKNANSLRLILRMFILLHLAD